MRWFFPSLPYQINLAVSNTEFNHPQPLIRLVTAFVPREVFFTPTCLTIVYWVAMTAGLLAIIGLGARYALLVYGLCYGFFVSHAYSYGDVHHREVLYFLFVLALAFSPAGQRLSVDALISRFRARRAGRPEVDKSQSDLAMWPLRFLHVLLAMTYFSTGVTKLLAGGLQWMNGYTLQFAIFRNAIRRAAYPPLGLWMAQQHTLCIFVSIGTILFETFFFVSLFMPRLAPLFFAGGVLFHLMLYLTSGHPFFEHMLLNATLFLCYDPVRFDALWQRIASLLRFRTATPSMPEAT
jgi:vitamin K-dependent gamma-carboxylase-like protein